MPYRVVAIGNLTFSNMMKFWEDETNRSTYRVEEEYLASWVVITCVCADPAAVHKTGLTPAEHYEFFLTNNCDEDTRMQLQGLEVYWTQK
jgi:hypothetical protein